MAIQNFLSGGFYGKLGDVVGQRWHNKRFVRTHVIPANPRTEKQQNNRHLFALATALAQQAYNINKGSPLWDTSKMGQFSLMVGTAKRRLQNGASPAEALPLYPDGHNPDIIITSLTPNWSSWGASVTVSDSSYTFTASRTLEVIVACYDILQRQNIFFNEIITFNAGQQFSYTFNTSNLYTLPAGSSIQAVSIDDASHGGASIKVNSFALTQPNKPTFTYNLSFGLFEYNSDRDFIESIAYPCPFFPEEVYFFPFRVYNSFYDNWYNGLTFPLWLEDNKIVVWFNIHDDFTFPVGCYFGPFTGTVECPTYFLTISFGHVDFSYP